MREKLTNVEIVGCYIRKLFINYKQHSWQTLIKVFSVSVTQTNKHLIH